MKIIAFTAKKETGKTTAVKYMMQKYPNAVQINFKDALIEELKLFFPELLAEIGKVYDNNPVTYDGQPWDVDRLFKEKPPLIRSLMRNWGTEFRRKEYPEYWTARWKTAVMMIDPRVTHVFVDDVRFLNEANAVKDLGGTIIRITSDKPVPEDAHGSEAQMDQIVPDKTVRNFFGDVEVMYKQLNQIADDGTNTMTRNTDLPISEMRRPI